MEILTPGTYDLAVTLNSEVLEGVAFVAYSSERPTIGVDAVVEIWERPELSIRALMGLSRACLTGTYIAVDGASKVVGGITMESVPGDPGTWQGKWTLGDTSSSVTIAPRQSLTDLGLAA